MNKFLSALVFTFDDVPGYFRLTAALGFYSDRLGRELWAEPGFLTNFVTGRKLLFVRRIVTDDMNPAAVIHDMLYSSGIETREMSDAVFRDAMLAGGVAPWRAYLAWAAVRTFGGRFYAPPRPEN